MENILSDMFSEKLIMIDVEADHWKSVLMTAGDYLYEHGYVESSFKEALIQREIKYPTGLPTSGIKVALPHTDAVHVKKPGILFMNLREPVAFKEMGNGERDVMVDMVFVIAVKHAENEVMVLRKLMGLLTDEDFLNGLKACDNRRVSFGFLTSRINMSYNLS